MLRDLRFSEFFSVSHEFQFDEKKISYPVLIGIQVASTVVTVTQDEGLHSTEVAFVLLTQQPRVQFSAFPRFFFSNCAAEID